MAFKFDPKKEYILDASLNNQYTLYPINNPDIFKLAKIAMSAHWVAEEIDFTRDLNDWENKLTDNERFFIKNVLAFFSSSDGIVNENLLLNFYDEVKIAEARYFYANQIQMESIHCVAQDTKILTDKGYFEIKEKVNEKVNVWNGHQFSEVLIQKTSDASKLYRVTLNNGMHLDCTENHKWHILIGNKDHPERCKNEIIFTKDLNIDDVIITNWTYPNLNNNDPNEFLNPYTHGFFCDDGDYYNNYPLIKLYGEKMKLLKYLNVSANSNIVDNKIYCYITNQINKEKFFVPINYSLETKLRWLEGFTDADGCLNYNNSKTNTSIQLTSINYDFLKNIQLMLSTLGIDSNLKVQSEEEYRLMPTNNINKEKHQLYLCKKSYVLYISCYNVNKLIDLGFEPKRVIIISLNKEISQQKSLIKIEKIEELPDLHETYCFNEPKNHTGIFNGIITGQSEVYSLLIDTYIRDPKEKHDLFNAISVNPIVNKKAEWCMKWMDPKKNTFPERLLAFGIIEGIFFSGSFCAIFWLKNRGLMSALCKSNKFIAKDENQHCMMCVMLYSKLTQKLPENIVHEMFTNAINIEIEFITKSLPVDLIGMNNRKMIQYIKYVGDFWLSKLKYKKLYNVPNPFPWMESSAIENKSNMFETETDSYAKAGIGNTQEDNEIRFDLDI